MIVYNYDADLEVSDTCVRSSLLSWVEAEIANYQISNFFFNRIFVQFYCDVMFMLAWFCFILTFEGFIDIIVTFCYRPTIVVVFYSDTVCGSSLLQWYVLLYVKLYYRLLSCTLVGLCYFMPGQQTPGHCWDAWTADAGTQCWCSQHSQPSHCTLSCAIVQSPVQIRHGKAVGKMRNCGLWNAEGKMRNGNCGKMVWNGG